MNMNFASKYYLPNSEERISRFQKIINGRPVAILAAGPSIKELEERICELRNADICYFGFNSFMQEKRILRQINKYLSVYLDVTETYSKIINFLDRDEDNMFVTSSLFIGQSANNSFDLDKFVNRYDKKLIFFVILSDRTVPSSNCPLHFNYTNALLVLIQLAVMGKASKIVLFGADGYCDKSVENYYYRSDGYISSRERLVYDTNVLNSFASIAIRNVCKTYNLKPVDILNCSEKSFYTPFPKVSYDYAMQYFLENKDFNGNLDLRVPKVSVIVPVMDVKNFYRETIQNISLQSYTNRENIIICGESDDKICDEVHEFSNTKWVSEKSGELLQMFKKGISISRGEYIFYCQNGDGYLNQDWFNTCVEVLENNPDISLVWGLSQSMHENDVLGRIDNVSFLNNPPSQKEYFIYYWLKKKILLPERNFCIRKRILEECLPVCDSKIIDEREAWVVFNYRFNTLGYLPYFVPTIANYCRESLDLEGEKKSTDLNIQKWMKVYFEDVECYKNKLIRKKAVHRYKNGAGQLSSGTFSCNIFLFFDIGKYMKAKFFNMSRYIKAKLPNVCCLAINKVLFFLRTYKWNVLSVAIIRIWSRMGKILK